MKITRRLGSAPRERDAACTPSCFCPDVFATDSGDVVVIGSDITVQAREFLPTDAAVGPDEQVVTIPRSVFEAAAVDLLKNG